PPDDRPKDGGPKDGLLKDGPPRIDPPRVDPPGFDPLNPPKVEKPKHPWIDIKPPNPVAIKPPVLQQEKAERKLPANVENVAGGGAGRFLVLHLPQLHKLAVFDVNDAAGKLKWLRVPEDGVKFAAGMNKLVVALPQAKLLERYSLPGLE